MEQSPTYKLRTRVGAFEFDADGPTAEVVSDFSAWRELVSKSILQTPNLDGQSPKPSIPSNGNGDGNNGRVEVRSDAIDPALSADAGQVTTGTGETDRFLTVFDATGRFGNLTLKVFPDGKTPRADAVLLMAYGYRRLRRHESTLSTVLADSLRVSGFNLGPRIDRAVEPHLETGLLLRSGRAKATRYRLTNTGVAKAEAIAKGLADKL